MKRRADSIPDAWLRDGKPVTVTGVLRGTYAVGGRVYLEFAGDAEVER